MTARRAKIRAEHLFVKQRTGVRQISEIVVRVAQNAWPKKTDYELALRLGLTRRSAQYVLAGRGLSDDAFANLLRSDIGFELLAEIMRGSGQRWWDDLGKHAKAAELKRKAEAARAEYETALKEAGI